MEPAEKPIFNKTYYLICVVAIAAALLLGATAYFGAGSAKQGVQHLDNAMEEVAIPEALVSHDTEQPPASGPVAAQGAPAPEKEVTIDFLYADWCIHCQAMKPIVARLEAALPKDRFTVRYWNEASRGNSTVAAVYADYTEKGYFEGFPTFVANGIDPLVGSRSESAFDAWVCSKFSTPVPSGC